MSHEYNFFWLKNTIRQQFLLKVAICPLFNHKYSYFPGVQRNLSLLNLRGTLHLFYRSMALDTYNS